MQNLTFCLSRLVFLVLIAYSVSMSRGPSLKQAKPYALAAISVLLIAGIAYSGANVTAQTPIKDEAQAFIEQRDKEILKTRPVKDSDGSSQTATNTPSKYKAIAKRYQVRRPGQLVTALRCS